MHRRARATLVDLDRFEPAGFQGLRVLRLQSGVLDPSRSRESLAFALFRDAGVPAPRTILAKVTHALTGKHEKA